MAGALVEMKHEWRRFKHDRPGERFENHRRRMEHRPRWHRIARGAGGGALIIIGIIFCFLPGPGLLGVVFGLALLAGMSRFLAGKMDRVEPRMRRGLDRGRRFWQRTSDAQRALVIALAAVVVAMGVIVVWRNWLGPMLS